MDDQKPHLTLEGPPDLGKHGKDYELEISKFILKRIIDQNFDDFSLTREKKGLGKFDDLAYIYESNGHRKFSLVQLKNLKTETTKIGFDALAKDKKNGKFFLPKYYNHYLESNKKIAADSDFTNCELESLIICTNVDFEQQLGVIQCTEVINNSNNDLFKGTGNDGKKLLSLKISDGDKKKIFSDSYVPDYEKLANEMVEHVMLYKPINIKDMKKMDDVCMVKKYHVPLARDVVDVDNGNKLRTEFLEAEENISSPEVFGLKKCFMKSAMNFCSKYNGFDCDQLQREFGIKLEGSQRLKQKIEKYNTFNVAVDFFKEERFAVMRNSSFGEETQYPDDIKDLPRIENVNDAEVNKKIDEFLNKLIFAVNQRNNDAVLRNELEKDVYIQFNKEMNKWYYNGCFTESGACLRNWITKRKITEKALNSKVNFHGKDCSLKNILPENEENQFLDPDILIRSFCSVEISIGSKFDLGEMRNYHINRYLSRDKFILVDQLDELLKGNENYVYIFSSPNQADISFVESLLPPNDCLQPLTALNANSCFFFVTEKTELSEILSEFLCEKSVHVIQFLEPVTSKGSIFHTKYIYQDDMCQSTGFSVIVGEPGMGKSTLVNSIAERLAEENSVKEKPDYVIKVELKCCWELIKEQKFRDIESIADFLTCLDGFKDHSFLKNVIRNFLEKDERIILLFDGFDELYCDETRTNMLAFLTYLRKKTKVKHVCVTSRPHLKEQLEEVLEVDSVIIQEITEDEQIKFLTKLSNPENVEMEKRIWKNSEKLVKKFKKDVGDVKTSFLGIPLQTHMFAIAYEKELTKDHAQIPESLCLYTLFEDFFRRKCEIYIEEKKGVKITNQNRVDILEEVEKYDNMHQYFALLHGGLLSKYLEGVSRLLLKDGEEWEFDNENLRRKRRKDIALKIGVLYEANGVMYFTHRAYAEYLVAKRMVSIILAKKDSKYKEAIEEILLKSDDEFLLYLFDQLLVENREFSVHKAAMKGDREKLKLFSKDELRSLDSLGRMPIYFAVQYRRNEIIDNLIDVDIPVNMEDRLLRKSLTSYEHEVFNKWIGKTPDKNDQNFIRFIKLAKYCLQIKDPGIAEQLGPAYSKKLEMETPNWKLFELLINSGSNLFFAENFCIVGKDCQIPMSVYKAVLNRIKNRQDAIGSLDFFEYIFNYSFIFLEVPEAKYLLNEFENRIQLVQPRVGDAWYYIYPFPWVQIILDFSSSFTDYIESFRNALGIYFLFLKLRCENLVTNPADIFTDSNNVRFFVNRIYSFYIDYEKLMIKFKSVQSVEDELANTVRRYKEETCLVFESDKTQEQIPVLVKHLLETSDCFKFLFSICDVTETTLGGNRDRLRECLDRANTQGWLKAAVRVSSVVLTDWERCFTEGVRSCYYIPESHFKIKPPYELRELISKYEKKIEGISKCCFIV